MKAFDNIGHQRPDDIGKKRDYKKCKHDEAYNIIISFHVFVTVS